MRFITTRPIRQEFFLAANPSALSGAWAIFFGLVRNHHGGRAVKKLYYECYLSMADSVIQRIKEEVTKQYALEDLKILHRVGMLEIGEIAIAVACTSAHRAESFAACEEAVERVKKTAPIWKKEFYEDGSSIWVAGCTHSLEAAA